MLQLSSNVTRWRRVSIAEARPAAHQWLDLAGEAVGEEAKALDYATVIFPPRSFVKA